MLCLVFSISGIMVADMTRTSHAVTVEGLRLSLPRTIMGWTAEPQDRIFDPTTIFSYINGGAEVYKAYNMQHCLSRRYTTSNGPSIVLDIFEMGSSEDAFGVFTHDTEGAVVEIGQDGRLQPGWLRFWKERYYVSIYMEAENAAAEKAVIALGQKVDAAIAGTGRRPEILQQLPRNGLETKTIRFLHHPVILNYHYYLSDENILNLAPDTDVILAAYLINGEAGRLLLVNYPNAQAAARAHAGFLKNYLPDADQSGAALLENQKWSAVRVKGRMLVIVLDADSRELAENLFGSVKWSNGQMVESLNR